MIPKKMKDIIMNPDPESFDDRYWDDFSRRVLNGELSEENAYKELEEYDFLVNKRKNTKE